MLDVIQGRELTAGRTSACRVVAIVDDDPQILHALTMWLELSGYKASCHTSAESVRQRVCHRNGKLALSAEGDNLHSTLLAGAILDLNLPGASGMDLARDLRSMDPRVPLTIITALSDDERVRYGSLPSGVRCIRKPFDLEALEEALFPLMH